MFSDVMRTLRSSGIDTAVALVHGPCGMPAAIEVGAIPLVQPSCLAGLNSALRWAVDEVAVDELVVVAADVPSITSADVREMLERPEDVVVAATQDGGTAAIRARPGRVVPLEFGGASANRHVHAARAARLSAVLLDTSDAYRDVDQFRDLAATVRAGTGPATTEVVRRLVEGTLAPHRR
jgi:2-phospho-L-lactate guanylyltransferase